MFAFLSTAVFFLYATLVVVTRLVYQTTSHLIYLLVLGDLQLPPLVPTFLLMGLYSYCVQRQIFPVVLIGPLRRGGAGKWNCQCQRKLHPLTLLLTSVLCMVFCYEYAPVDFTVQFPGSSELLCSIFGTTWHPWISFWYQSLTWAFSQGRTVARESTVCFRKSKSKFKFARPFKPDALFFLPWVHDFPFYFLCLH